MADLIHEFGQSFTPAIKGARKASATAALHAITAKEEEVADFAVLDALVKLLQVAAMAGHEAHADFEILFHGLLGEGEHAAGTWAVARERLFHENVDAFFDGVLEMDPAEGERSGEDGDVAFAESVDGVLKRIEAEKLVVVDLNIAPGFGVAFEAGEGSIKFAFEDIRHGDKFGAAFLDGEGVFGGAAAASAASDKSDFDLIAALGVNCRESDAGESGYGRGGLGGGFKECTAGSGLWWESGVVHRLACLNDHARKSKTNAVRILDAFKVVSRGFAAIVCIDLWI